MIIYVKMSLIMIRLYGMKISVVDVYNIELFILFINLEKNNEV